MRRGRGALRPAKMRQSRSLGSLSQSLPATLKEAYQSLDAKSWTPTGDRRPNTDDDILGEEAGTWRYLVVDTSGIKARADSRYSKDTKINGSGKFREGTIVEVDRRRKDGWTTWLHVRKSTPPVESEWLFDVSPKDRKVRMVEVEVVEGSWMYEACELRRAPILPFPSLALALRKGGREALALGEAMTIVERVRPVAGKGSFLKLEDGRGWVLDFVDGHRVVTPCPVGYSSGSTSNMGCPSTPSGAGSERRLSSAQSERRVGTANSQGSNGSVVRERRFSIAHDTRQAALVATVAAESVPVLDYPNLGPPENGSWDYVVLDPQGMCLRDRPSTDAAHKADKRIEDGDLVRVVERRAGDGCYFLRLAFPQGWACDRRPGEACHVRMMEVNVERGSWLYRITAEKGVSMRTSCSLSSSTKCGRKGVQCGAVVAVNERVRVAGTTFLRLKEEGLWIFDRNGGRERASGPLPVEVPPSRSRLAVDAPQGVMLRHAPTDLKWAGGTKMRLLNDARVQVSMLLEIQGVHWAYVTQCGGSLQGWMSADSLKSSGDAPQACSSEAVLAADARHGAAFAVDARSRSAPLLA